MHVQYQNPAKPDMIDGEWRSPKCDAQARLELTVAASPAYGTPSTTAGVPKTPKNVPTGSAEPIVGAATPARLVRVQVEFDPSKPNAYVCIGDSTVTLANGEQLGPGDVYSEAVDDAAKLFCVGSEAGLKLRIKVL
ncbi:MAG TPA: hypothetical protein PKA58_23530 [Polyangium sp.]|nr:hypothetical protein [Polyangium sp.]